MATLTVTLVTQNGTVDQEASRQAFDKALSNYVVEQETEQSTIAETVSAIFDAHPGTALTMPMIASMACSKLNAQPENFRSLETRVLDYVRANASEKREDGKLFRIGKGKGGGCRLWSSIPVEAPAASK